MATSTVEDYVKQIFLIQQELDGETAPMGRLSEAMEITPGTTTTMVKSLADDGLVSYEPRIGVRLTPKGESLALGVLRRHRIAEAFLVQILGMDWSEVHDDAEQLEHAISDKVLDRMDALLNRPTHDPHGDPIPPVKGSIAYQPLKSLSSAEIGLDVRVARIVDQSQEFLTFVRRSGMEPGARLTVIERDSVADSVQVQLKDGKQLALSTRVAEKIAVE